MNAAFADCCKIVKEAMVIKDFGIDDVDPKLKELAEELLIIESKIGHIRRSYKIRDESPLETFLREGKTGL